MKKLSLIVAALFMLVPLFGEKATSTSSMELSAYKNGQIESSSIPNTTVTISTFSSQSISGVGNNYVLLDENTNLFDGNNSRENAFSITINTTGKAPIKATITLTPFINVSDSSSVKAIYKFTGTANPTVTTPDNASNSVILKVGNNRYYCRAFQYTPSLTLKIQNGQTIGSGNSFEVGSDTVLELTQGIASVSFKYATSKNAAARNWTSTTIASPSSSALEEYKNTTNGQAYGYSVLPPNMASPTLSSTARFDLSVDSNDLQGIVANTEYAATVTITITSGT